MFLAAAALVSCSYDSSEVESSITDLEQRIAALEQKADDLESQLKSVSDFASASFISRIGTDEKGNYVITYKTRDGQKKTVTLAKASDLSKAPMIGVAEDEGTMYWRMTSDNGATWEWILNKSGARMPVATATPEIGIDKDGFWTVGGKSTGVLAGDTTNSIFKSVETNEKGLAVFTLTDGSSFSVAWNEALGITFSTPSFLAVEDYDSAVTVGYTLTGALAKDAVVDYLTAYNVNVKVYENMSSISVTMEKGAEEGNTVIMVSAGDEVIYKPLFFTYGKTVIDFENYIKDNELITPMGEPVINLGGEMAPFTIRISHNIDVEASAAAECSSWLKAVSTKALTTSEFNFVAEYFESKSNTPREGRIILKNSLYDVTTSILVKQSPVVKGGGGGDDPSAEKGISDAGTFMEFVRSVNAGASTSRWENADGEICLLTDIDLTGIEWTPIGNATSEGTGAPTYTFANAFKGKFNGNGHSITGISWTCDMSKNSVYGLFGAADGATIRNLTVGAEGDAITLTGTPEATPSVAGIIGYAENVTISSVTNNVSIILEGECPQAMPTCLAGIVGSGFNVTIGGKTREDAVVNNGDILVKSKVANAQAGGTGLQVAGIMGYVKQGKGSSFISCTNKGHLTGPNGRSGGIIATIYGSEKAGNKVTISKCINNGLIEDNYLDHEGYSNAKRMGGLIGGSEAANVSVESCTNNGNIFSHTGCRAGGFVGHFKGGIIAGCANTGIILSKITPQNEDHTGGDGPGWAAGYCNIKITGCTRGGKVGEWAEYKDKPEQAPDATVYNAYGYQNSKYFNAADNQ